MAKAKALAPELDWTKPDPETLRTGVEEQETSEEYLLVRQARRALNDKVGSRQGALQRIDQAVPHQTRGDGNPYVMLARPARVGGISG